jgi:SAM-dependent methyltransferase
MEENLYNQFWMVQNDLCNKMKEKIYNIIADSGIWVLNKLFPEYFAKEPLNPTDRYVEYPWAIKYIREYNNPIILDVGCSGSIFPSLLTSLTNNLFGIDIRECLVDINFIKQDITKTTLANNYFDIVTAISTIEHIGLSGRYGVEKNIFGDKYAVNEIYRILKTKGIFLMTVPYGNKYKETKFHKIYDDEKLSVLLKNFTWDLKVINSPESKKYKLALIKAIK